MNTANRRPGAPEPDLNTGGLRPGAAAPDMNTGDPRIDAAALDVWYINRSIRLYTRDALRPLGLNIAEAIALKLLDCMGGEASQRQLRCQISEISASGEGGLPFDKGLMTRTMQSLESKEYVLRGRNPNDNRSFLFCLTGKGREFCALLNGIMTDLVDKALAGIPEEELEHWVRVLNKVKENLGKAIPGKENSEQRDFR
ncbi:MAG TPA: MarR family winged helix-turn-helix transcriptional regulator [Terriglobales bacterium]|nr:MarR family winged helix-turn-helix transcriptional regulator [Terriglobales bacterium]